MRGFWLFVHNIGYTLWLGGGIATMIAGITAKRFPPAERLAAYRVSSAVQRLLVGPGALGVVISGIVLSMTYMKAGAMPNWMGYMMGTGLIGAMAAVALSVPAAAHLGSLKLDERGELPPSFAALRKRQVITATAAGSLGLISLAFATFGRYG